MLLAVSEEAKTFFRCSMCNKTFIRFGFCDIQNNQGRGEAEASADNPYLDLDYSGYHKKPHPIIVYYLFFSTFSAVRNPKSMDLIG